MNPPSVWSRRHFLTGSVAALALSEFAHAAGKQLKDCPVASFSKVFQELKLDFDAGAEVAAEAGLQGIDCPVRPGGEILPERAADDLPRYAEALKKRKLKLLLLTTAILHSGSPHAETILRTARGLGVTHYRLGYWTYTKDVPREKVLAEAKAQLKDLAALNRQLGMCGVYQNHSGAANFGATLSDLRMAIEGLNPKEIGVAFDPSHAIVQIGDAWRDEFEKLKPHFQIAYVKDARRDGKFVRFGDGDVGRIGYFTLLKQLGYSGPISMHTEYEWADGQPKTRERLVAAMKHDLAQLKRWLEEA
jgi:sugar phosphate isomerase/epimerase